MVQEYFYDLKNRVMVEYSIAENARAKGFDPVSKVEIPLATNLAEKVIGLISLKYPQLNDPAVVKRIRELEEEYGSLDYVVSLKIAEEIAKEKFCKFKNLLEAIDAGIRVGFAYITLGVVSSPMEGFVRLELKKTRKGKDFFAVYYSGPVRSAGGTGAAFSLVLADHLRETFGFEKYDPTDDEIKRIITEIHDYHERITNLQYMPSDEEIEFLAKNIPVMIHGDASENKEVSNYRDLDRIETNFIRGGFALVFAEAIAQKAPKILRILNNVRKKGICLKDWDWLNDFVDFQKKQYELKKTEKLSATYISDLVAGRPVFSHPSRSGGFRLRYGRCRVSGYSCLSIHPATMVITDGFLAIGSQLKIERPTKGAALSVCDTIMGPIVKLKNGSVIRIETVEKAKEIFKEIEEIVYIGDILIPFGDFVNRNHNLLYPGYNEDYWWVELKEKIGNEREKFGNKYFIDLDTALKISREFKIPLHPNFIFFWTQISKEQFFNLIDWLKRAIYFEDDKKIIFKYGLGERNIFKEGKRALELLGINHNVTIENVVINYPDSLAFLINLGLNNKINKDKLEEIKKGFLGGSLVEYTYNFHQR